MDILFASHNEWKIKEIKDIVIKYHPNIKIKTYSDFGYTEDVEETGNTFNDNAYIKAKHAYDMFKVPCFGEDSGLEVDALCGNPGVYSARYAGDHDYKANNALVLKDMEECNNRTARMISSVYFMNGVHAFWVNGITEGTITEHVIGEGFSYDVIFKPVNSNKTFSQMSLLEKQKFSHRKKAIDNMIKILDKLTWP